ncbi:MAG: MBL fold metallo-hydrolase [Gemmataceae bacterium]|nr:MBL fold metallo-hydrolase [Gemmataceae bacterium]
MRLLSFAISVLCCLMCGWPLLGQQNSGLRIYWVDVEGGAATLLVTPAGESILIDSGNPGRRDAERIHRVATERAGLKAIDHHVITHWHLDHYGGIERLSQLMPIRHFYHRGIPDSLPEDRVNFPVLIKAFKAAAEGRETTLKPGDRLPLKAVDSKAIVEIRCLCGSGEVVPDEPTAAENPLARDHKPQPEDPTDNAKSLGFLIKFGGFRFLDLGDLTWNIEYKLVAPTDKIGPVDVYQSTHHGLEVSNNPVLMRTVQPRVVVFNNGPRKGAHPTVIANLRRLPEVPDIYQLHRNLNAMPHENTEPKFIANESADCGAEPIWLEVAADGRSYTVHVGATGFSKRYNVKHPE